MKPTMKPRKPTKPMKPTKPTKPKKPTKPMKKGGAYPQLSDKRMGDFYSSLPNKYERRAAFYDTRMGLAQKMRDVGDYIGKAYIGFKDKVKRRLEDREDRKANIPPLRSSRSSRSSLKPIRESQQRESLRESSKHKLLPLPQRMSRSTNTKNTILLPLPPQRRILLPLPQQRIPY